MLVDDKRIVLKPVHRIALREALEVAAGVCTKEHSNETLTLSPPRGHVLLVEDEPVNAAVAEGYLEALGCTFAWVKTGTDAAARSSSERFDLILMDLNMPDMDGFAATKLIRQREDQGKRVPIIALTAHEAGAYREKCQRADMDDILSKPYALDDFARLLQKWLIQRAAPSTSGNDASAATLESLTRVDTKIIDELRRLGSGKPSNLHSRLIELFSKGSAESMTELDAAFQGNDYKAAAAVCHKLASSASNVGAAVFGNEARRLERFCLANDSENARALFERLRAAHEPLLDALRSPTSRVTA